MKKYDGKFFNETRKKILTPRSINSKQLLKA